MLSIIAPPLPVPERPRFRDLSEVPEDEDGAPFEVLGVRPGDFEAEVVDWAEDASPLEEEDGWGWGWGWRWWTW